MKQNIKVRIQDFDIHYIDGLDLKSISEYLSEIQADCERAGYTNIFFKIDSEWDSSSYEIWGYRLENDGEYKKRLLREEKERNIAERKKLSKEQKELAELKRLKKKYNQ